MSYEGLRFRTYRVKNPPGVCLLHDQSSADTFTELVREMEPRLRRALTAGFGSEIGREAAAEALA